MYDRDKVLQDLRSNVIEVHFIKTNGENRVMRCTLLERPRWGGCFVHRRVIYLPSNRQPAGARGGIAESIGHISTPRLAVGRDRISDLRKAA